MKFCNALALGVALSALSTAAVAQDAMREAQEGMAAEVPDPVLDGDSVIVVTGVARAQNRLETSNSLSVLDSSLIADLNPRSTADLIRQIPGIRSEASGGEGNANIAVRGIPVSTGGARYIQLQEDGLPVLEFGDIVFGNADNFVRPDRNVARVEAVRGGAASTFASNSPGGVINFISKTGQREGGSLVGAVGLDHESYRMDFDYGAPLGTDTYFHVGGFYRIGEGARNLGYSGSNGGQVRANLTQEFESGYVRFYGKYLNDKTPTVLPQPVFVGGTDGNPDYQAIANFDPRTATLYSRYINKALTLDGNNNPQAYDYHDGLSVESKAFGVETEFEFAPEWTLTNRFRYSANSGAFLSPFPASAGNAQSIADGIGGPGSSIVFASGPQAGATANPATIGGNGLLTNIVTFNTRLNNLDLVANDLRISRDFDFSGGLLSFTGGFYASRQNVDTDWLWTSHVQTVEGDGNSVLVDIVDAAGNTVTQNGVVGYSASFFGNCCRRNYDVRYNTYAPFAALVFETGPLTLEASARYDYGSADGSITGSDTGFGSGITSFDFDNNGTISPAEASTAVLPLGDARPVNYNFDYFSFSIGANYLLTDDLAVFGRYSQGGRHTADRSLFSPAVSTLDGQLAGGDDNGVIARVDQAELGVKYQGGGLQLYGTAFYAKTAETNVEIAPLVLTDNKYRAYGLEVEGSYKVGPFSVSGGATYTDSKIVDALNAAIIGNRPRRQADFVYQGTVQYEDDAFTAAVNAIGTSDSFTQDNNGLVLPGYTQVNAFLAFRPLDRLELGLNANNLFDQFGYTEAEEGSIPANGIVRARSIAGRTLTASVRIDF